LEEGGKKNLRQHSVLDWSPTSILSGPCDACLRGSDETRNVHRGMAADKIALHYHSHIPHSPNPFSLPVSFLSAGCASSSSFQIINPALALSVSYFISFLHFWFF
jgi:hypothetical protein